MEGSKMLVLSRKEKQEIVFSRDGTVIGSLFIVEITSHGTVARLGFDGFDKSIRIDRREVFDKVQEEKVNATNRQDDTTAN